ncbi:MAG TPA: aspartate dehydrogenase [Candidatus Omnitrophica bacterium]|nr:MAG: hypothetical protein A2Y05_01660 [Omnitrophica WOR_2 bacterium GWA2_53_43]HBO97735.1 aspartate dehydrogenase [Candidatus Omnitrophota bacterium]HCI45239.1 aspartate dehydrogenase [Candidatus Omnitrophota bacterium]
MSYRKRRLKIGIVGCGAIGGGIARYILKGLKKDCQLTGLYDIEYGRVERLRRELSAGPIGKSSLQALLKSCDLMIEAVNANSTREIVRGALLQKRNVIAMSVGKLLDAQDLFDLARKRGCHLLIPSGAIAGIDAIKSASLARIRKISLTTRKPLSGFSNNVYLSRRGVDLAAIRKETVLFTGNVDSAVKFFPQNINVAATLALASRAKNKITVCIMTSPGYKVNSHEIEIVGDFGRIVTRTDNVVSPENPRTSYLAVLSGMQTLKQFCQGTGIGT